MSTRIGCSNVHYALMDEEDTIESLPTYKDVQECVGLMSLSINPNGAIDTLFADDGPFDTAVTIGSVEVEVEKAYLTDDELSTLLGKTHQDDTVVSASDDTPPWLALGFKALKSNGSYRYIWLYKGKFQDVEASQETKGDSINWQSDTISGNFAALKYEGKWFDGCEDAKAYMITFDCDEYDDVTVTDDSWFANVVLPDGGDLSYTDSSAASPTSVKPMSTKETEASTTKTSSTSTKSTSGAVTTSDAGDK